MSKKATLVDVSSGYSSGATLNSNFEALNDKFDNTLSLDGSTPNSMGADLDMNSNDVLNASSVSTTLLYVNGVAVSPSSLTADEGIWFDTVTLLKANASLTYTTGQDETVSVGTYIKVRDGYTYKVAGSGVSDHHISTSGGVKLYVQPDEHGFNLLAFDADNTGTTAIDTIWDTAVTAARANDEALYIPSGFYRVESGLDVIGSESTSGFATNLQIQCAGAEATVFFSSGAPSYVLRIDARYVRMDGFSIWGARDQIRDSSNSAPIGLWVENMREGGLTGFKVQNIVGSGVQIDKCIVSQINGIVYRCGSNTKRAVEQTDSAQDGCQASVVYLNVEDGLGSLGATKFLSHRNTSIELKLENQPYHICEVTSPSGNAAKNETITFSGGATGTVGLASADPSAGTQGQLIVSGLDETGGALAATQTFTTSGGASGTVSAFVFSGGPQFETAGDYGDLTIWANQSALKTSTDGDIIIDGTENTCRLLKVRGPHKAKNIVVSGDDNLIVNAEVEVDLTDIADEADHDWAIELSGTDNTVIAAYTQESKGVNISGAQNVVQSLRQESLYGQPVSITGNYSRVDYIDSTQDTYTDSGGDLDVTSLVNIAGDHASVGRLGGILNLPYNGDELVLLSGESSFLGPVDITVASSVVSYVVRMTGANARVSETKIAIPATKVGIRNVSASGQIFWPVCAGGATGVELVEDGASLIGGVFTGYTARGVGAQPGTAKTRIRIQDVECRDESGTPTYDIQVSNNVDYSHLINNNVNGGVGSVTWGTGANNITTGNIL